MKNISIVLFALVGRHTWSNHSIVNFTEKWTIRASIYHEYWIFPVWIGQYHATNPQSIECVWIGRGFFFSISNTEKQYFHDQQWMTNDHPANSMHAWQCHSNVIHATQFSCLYTMGNVHCTSNPVREVVPARRWKKKQNTQWMEINNTHATRVTERFLFFTAIYSVNTDEFRWL